MARVLATLIILYSLILFPPRSQSAPGRLYILGGSMALDNVDVWEGILNDKTEGPIGVIPTASSSPESAANLLVETFNEYLPNSAIPLMITESNPSSVEDPQIIELISTCGGFYFTGGDQRRIGEVLFDNGGSPTSALAAIYTAHQNGAVVAGSSAGAAIMSDPMITGGNSYFSLIKGLSPSGVQIDKGLGFFPYGITDQHFLERGRLGRLLIATMESGEQLGFGVDDNTGFVIDFQLERGSVIGAMGVINIDVSKSIKEEMGRIRGIRLSYLDRGDLFDFTAGEIQPTSDKREIDFPIFRDINLGSNDIWDDYEVWRLCTGLVDTADQNIAVGRSGPFDLLFIKTPNTNAWKGETHVYENYRRAYTVQNMELHILLNGENYDKETFFIY